MISPLKFRAIYKCVLLSEVASPYCIPVYIIIFDCNMLHE